MQKKCDQKFTAIGVKQSVLKSTNVRKCSARQFFFRNPAIQRNLLRALVGSSICSSRYRDESLSNSSEVLAGFLGFSRGGLDVLVEGAGSGNLMTPFCNNSRPRGIDTKTCTML